MNMKGGARRRGIPLTFLWELYRRRFMIQISLCMIVKNEEKILKRCLDSIVDLMDEIIIVDTGSLDRTKEIAKKYTNNVYDYQWKDDFADARNFSFSKATKDYIYCADADEVLDEENKRRFAVLKEAMIPEIDIVQMYYCNQLNNNTIYNFDRELRPKLYKRNRSFVWHSPIHEIVRLEPVIYDSDIEIMHMSQGNHAKRDLKAFASFLKRGEKLDKRLHNMYAKELLIAGDEDDLKEALPFFLKSQTEEERSVEEIREAFCIGARAGRIVSDKEVFFKSVIKSLAQGGSAEICYELGEYYFEAGDYKEASLWFYNAAFETEPFLDISLGNEKALDKLADCYGRLGRREAEEEMRKAAKERKDTRLRERMGD